MKKLYVSDRDINLMDDSVAEHEMVKQRPAQMGEHAPSSKAKAG